MYYDEQKHSVVVQLPGLPDLNSIGPEVNLSI